MDYEKMLLELKKGVPLGVIEKQHDFLMMIIAEGNKDAFDFHMKTALDTF